MMAREGERMTRNSEWQKRDVAVLDYEVDCILGKGHISGPSMLRNIASTSVFAKAWNAAADRIEYLEGKALMGEAIYSNMIAPLVWEKHSSNATVQPKHFYSGMYSLIHTSDGYLVDFNNLSLGHGYSLGQAKSLADSHHRAAIMAKFKGEDHG
jgi:hypothetical protein